jgi:hypothetical protein
LKKQLLAPPKLSALLCIATVCVIGAFILIGHSYKGQRSEGDIPSALTLDRISHLHILCEIYRDKTGSWPTSIPAVTNVVSLDSANDLQDGWGRQMLLIPATNSPGAVILISYGADGIPGGTGTNGDIFYLLK